MSCHSLGFLALLSLTAYTTAAAEVKRSFGSFGGEVRIKESRVSTANNELYKVFVVEAPKEGEFAVSAWADGFPGKSLKVSVNGETKAFTLGYAKRGWQSAKVLATATSAPWSEAASPAKVRLLKGPNTITFWSHDGIAVPAVDYVTASLDPAKAVFSEQPYDIFVKDLIWYSDRARQESSGSPVIASPNPLISYSYSLNRTFTYTFRSDVNLSQGASYSFTLSNKVPANHEPTLHVFRKDSPESHSWYAWDGPVSFTAPASGLYQVVLAAGLGTGTADIYLNGSLLAAGAPAAGNSSMVGSANQSGVMNYFTARITGDPYIYLLEGANSPMLVRGFNDDYGTAGGDFPWGYASRIKKQFSQNISWMRVSAYSSNQPTGNFDGYMHLSNSNAYQWFPNFKADDAIKTSNASNIYNCIAWTGGRTGNWDWPIISGSPWYVAGNPLASFDNYYLNRCPNGNLMNCRRYPGAWNYTRSGATSSNSAIDLWYNPTDETYTHASIKNGNGDPHGYDWESKPGQLERTMHHRNSLYNLAQGGYGQIQNYYIHNGTFAPSALGGSVAAQGLTEEESIRSGLAVQERARLSPQAAVKLSALKKRIPATVAGEFARLYSAWAATWNSPSLAIHGNPLKYAESDEFDALVAFASRHGKALWPLAIERLDRGDFLSINLLMELCLPAHGPLMEDVVRRASSNPYTADGKYILPSLESNWVRFSQALLDSHL